MQYPLFHVEFDDVPIYELQTANLRFFLIRNKNVDFAFSAISEF